VTALESSYIQNRARTRAILSTISNDAYWEAPIPLRHPFVFYHGHLPAFSFLTLNRRSRNEAPIDDALEELFRRGIDPEDRRQANDLAVDRWPAREEVERFVGACDDRVMAALRADRPADRLAIDTILEHEAMHHETLMYIVHELSYAKKSSRIFSHRDDRVPVHEPISISHGSAVLGYPSDGHEFTWDNERDQHTCDVGAFAIDRYNVTNGDWLAFVEEGGPTPHFWERVDGSWRLRACYERLPLPKSWPVYVTHEQAQSYAAWKGARLPSEAEYHRAAFTSPWGELRRYPWGDEPPSERHGNFNFRRYDPEPVTASPSGASAWGVEGLVGNGWEWTGTPFAPFPHFTPMPTYPEYSADFFDGRHYVLKGASPVTAHTLIRPSFRNWFYSDYPYVYATFRCVR